MSSDCAIVANAEDSRCRIAGVRVRLPRREEIRLTYIILPVFREDVFIYAHADAEYATEMTHRRRSGQERVPARDRLLSALNL